MMKHWSGVIVLALALTAFGCGETANGGNIGGNGGGGDGGSGGIAGSGGTAGMGGMAGMGGEGGMGGMGGVGGMPDLCEDAATRCDDSNECTENVCNPADGVCTNPNETNGTSCDFSGQPGICTDGVCEDAMLCADAGTRCDDANQCTQNLCEPADGVCSNPNEPDDTECEFAEGVGGVCTNGVCEDAMLCADAATRCDDSNECTDDDCDQADGVCSNVAVADDTVCEFSEGVGGVCANGACIDAMLCADAETRCDDENQCTQNLCDSVDGDCSYPNEPDDTECEFSEGVGGVCTNGVCEDAMYCADAATRCDDENQCTEDDCDPADGACSNLAVPDDTECEFSEGVGGVCTNGVCEDAMYCADAATRCDDMNECTDDVCDPADGTCTNPNLPAGSACDVTALPEECDGAGACVAVCAPAPGKMVLLPTADPPAPTYTDMTNGFTISAVGGDITTSFRGLGSNAAGGGLAFDMDTIIPFASDSFVVEFFDQNGVSRTASNVSIVLHPQGISGTADVRVDGGLAVSVSMTTGQANIVSVASASEIEVTSTAGQIFWQQLDYDHDCL